VSWEEQARCLHYDPELFFAPRARAQRKAKAICGKCGVREACLTFALELRIEHGVWGGMNVDERRTMMPRAGGGRGASLQVAARA
jgi:WhiB family redox-sensing transcriptional regulator